MNNGDKFATLNNVFGCGLWLAFSLFYSSFALAEETAPVATQNSVCGSLVAKVAGSSKEHSKLDKIFEIMTGDHRGQGQTALLDRAVPMAENLTPHERIEFTERCISSPDARAHNHWMADFVLKHVLKTKSEDPVYGLTGDELFALFKKFDLEASGELAQQHKRFFPALTQQQLAQLTQMYSENHPGIMKTYGDVFGMSEEQKIAVFLSYARSGGRFIIRESRYGTASDHVAKWRKYGYFPIDLPKAAERRILRTALANDALSTLQIGALSDIPAIENDTPLEAPTGQPSIQHTVELIAQKYPELIHPTESKILWDSVKNIEVGFRILAETAKINERGIPTPETSLKAISLAMGYNAKHIEEAKISDRQTSQLYELSLDLSLNLEKPPFEGVAIDAEIWKSKNHREFLDLVGNLRDLSHLYGNNQSSWERVTTEIGLRNGIRPESLSGLKIRTREAVVKELENAFKESNISIARHELDDLYKRWGSIEPIITLVARFKGTQKWKNEIPVLARVVKSVLGNQFEKYKYEGDPTDAVDQEKAKQQLHMLTGEPARAAWKQNRTRIDQYDPNRVDAPTDTEAERVSRARIIAQTNLIPNLRERAKGPLLEGPLKEKLLERVLGNKTPSPRELLRTVTNDAKIIELTLLHELSETKDAMRMRKIASFLKGNATSYVYSPETISDLSSIISALIPPKKAEPSIIFTSTFDNPKMLLTIGDLVDTSSCQNYKTGSYIETLLGYVVDGGVKGLTSYVLKPTNFAKLKDYSILSDALQAKANGDKIEVHSELDGDKGIVHLRISGPGQQDILLDTLPLGKAQLRVVIKVGKTDSGLPGLFVERPYEQSHAARPLIMDHVNQIQNEIVGAIGGVTSQEIDIPGSRNIGGVYSDASGGIQRDDYRIKPSNERP